MPLLITNGRIVTATEERVADIYCEGESIARVEANIDRAALPPDTQIIDATGKLVFPGFIDPHVHIHLPFMGTHAKDTWETASRAALLGGTTSLVEMICPPKTDEPLAAFEEWLSKAQGISACDYSFHMGVTRYDEKSEQQLREIVRRGITSFKVFLAYKGALDVDDRELYHTLKLARELGVIVTAHCENATLIAEKQAEFVAAGKLGPEWHEPSRPTDVEAEGVHHLMTFAALTGAETYIVHTSCSDAVVEAQRARERGVKVWIESVIPHLVLDKSYAERADFEGAKYVMSPPLRDKPHQEFLWQALRERTISTIGTDHAPFDFRGQKDMGRPPAPGKDFTKIPNGIPSIEHRIDLLYTHGVRTGRIDLHTLVDCASTQPARIFGMTRKGDVAPGMDADLVIYDTDHRATISARTHHMATDYNAFEGFETRGRASVVTIRGVVMVRDGAFVGTMGHGRLIDRTARPR
jgi:dihydropyrimidinase